MSVFLKTGTQVDLRIVKKDELGAALVYFTGSKQHNIELRNLAIEKGWKLNEYALADAKSGKVVASKTEEEVYAKLGLEFIPPELREARGEVEAAKEGKLPNLVEVGRPQGRPPDAQHVERRQRRAGEDGAGRDGERLRVHRLHRPLGLRGHRERAQRGAVQEAVEGHRRAQREAEAVQGAEGGRGGGEVRREPRLRERASSTSSTSSAPPSTRPTSSRPRSSPRGR